MKLQQPFDPCNLVMLARCTTGKEAFYLAQRALLLDPESGAVWCALGTVYHKADQPRDALDAYMRAIQADSNMPEAWHNLGLLYAQCNGTQSLDSVDAFAQARRLGGRRFESPNPTEIVHADPRDWLPRSLPNKPPS